MKTILTFVLSLLISISMFGQPLQFLGDLNPGPGNTSPGGSLDFFQYKPAVFFNDLLFFSGSDTISGQELYTYDGEDLKLVADLRSGKAGSNPNHFHILNDKLLFIAYDTLNGYEWRVTDGTAEGTNLVKDIFPGKNSGVSIDASASFLVIGDFLYFAGEDEENNAELWKTDGTEAGTVQVRNIGEDFSNFNSRSYPTDFYEFNEKLVFNTINDGLWISDGSEEGTIQLSTASAFNFASLDSIFIFQGSGLYKSDGTPENTTKYADVGYSSFYNHPGNRFTKVGDVVVFPAFDEAHGDELWRTDATAEGTYLVKDLIEGSGGYPPQNFATLDDVVYYKGKSDASGTDLFSTDGTEAGTDIAVEFLSGSSSGLSAFAKIWEGNEYLIVRRGTFSGFHITYGSSEETKRVNTPGSTSNPPKNFFAFEDQLLFYAYTEETGYEPYILDITRLFTPADIDMDGFTEDVDCDDSNAEINPDQQEIPYNGIDDDCNSATLDDDLDEDGFNNDVDCDDNNASINSGAEDIPDNGIDENCDGEDAITSSLNEIALKSTIFPNPVYHVLNVSENTGIEIINSTGRILQQSEVSASKVNVSDYPSGIYFISIFQGTDRKIVRFTKL